MPCKMKNYFFMKLAMKGGCNSTNTTMVVAITVCCCDNL